MPTVTRTNLCTNPSLEAGITGWAAGGTPTPTVAQSAVWSWNRSKSLLITWATGNTFFPGAAITVTGLTVGVVYTFSAYVYVPAGNPAVQLIAAGSGLLAGSATSATNNIAGERLSVSFTATATSHTLGIYPSGSPTSGQICYVDGILAEQAPVVATYFDGASSGCQWTGTADLSTSQQLDGPLSITVTSNPGNQPPQNILYVTGAPGTTAQITRTDPDGTQRPVRGGDPATLSGTQWVGYDYEMPYAAGVTYTVIPSDASPNAFTTVPALGVTQAWLIHPGIPSLSQPINNVSLLDAVQSDSGSTAHQVLSRERPVVVTDGTRHAETMQVGLRTASTVDKAAMKALLQDASTLLLQVVYPFTAESEWRYVTIGRIARNRFTKQFGDQRRAWVLDCTDSDRPAGGVAAQRTWADVLAEAGTWQDVLNKYKTWTGVVTGIAGS